MIPYSPLLSQYQSYWYNTVHFYPRTSLTYSPQYTNAPVPVLLICHSPLLAQYQSYSYPTVHYYPSTILLIHCTLLSSASPVGTLQSPIDQFHLTDTFSLIDTTHHTTFQVPFLLIIHCSTLLPQYQFYWYVAVHYWPSSSLIDTFQSTSISTSPIDTTEFISATVLILLKPYILLLPQYQSYWYNTVNYCPSTSSDTLQSTTIPVPVLLVICQSLSQYQSCWYQIVYPCPSTSPSDTLQFTTASVSVLLVFYSPGLLGYQIFWYLVVHNCPNTCPTDTL